MQALPGRDRDELLVELLVELLAQLRGELLRFALYSPTRPAFSNQVKFLAVGARLVVMEIAQSNGREQA